ncbi:MAG: hypothetical protein QM715_13820 [Nibricoccus sp.]
MKRLFSVLALFVATHLSAADPYKIGDKLDSFTVKDQHEKEYAFAPGPRVFLVSFEMGTGKKANKWFAEKGADFLPQKQAIFLADIHGMPGVGRVFALPKMKKYPHRILLGDAKDLLSRYPKQDDKLTLLRLDESAHITAIEFVDPEKGLDSIFIK